MPFHNSGSIRFYTSDILEDVGVIHAIFTRRGGLSPEPWASLNVGGLVGDDPRRVYKNRVLSFIAIGRAPESVYDAWQVHGDKVICTNSPRPSERPHQKADAILTDNPEVTLFMRFADCVPILLFDPVKRVAGLAHAGWKGTVAGIAQRTVESMKNIYGCSGLDIHAVIGPSIGPTHYEVGAEVAEQVRKCFGQDSDDLLLTANGAVYFDLWSANRLQLEKAGLMRIAISNICTACHLDDWYSYRGEPGRTGRFGVMIALKPS